MRQPERGVLLCQRLCHGRERVSLHAVEHLKPVHFARLGLVHVSSCRSVVRLTSPNSSSSFNVAYVDRVTPYRCSRTDGGIPTPCDACAAGQSPGRVAHHEVRQYLRRRQYRSPTFQPEVNGHAESHVRHHKLGLGAVLLQQTPARETGRARDRRCQSHNSHVSKPLHTIDNMATCHLGTVTITDQLGPRRFAEFAMSLKSTESPGKPRRPATPTAATNKGAAAPRRCTNCPNGARLPTRAATAPERTVGFSALRFGARDGSDSHDSNGTAS